jgi:hypothetical protein
MEFTSLLPLGSSVFYMRKQTFLVALSVLPPRFGGDGVLRRCSTLLLTKTVKTLKSRIA